MLKHRILFGILMAVFFGGVAIVDGVIDGSVTVSKADDKAVQGTLLAVVVAVVMALATAEFARLAAAKGLKVFRAACIPAVALLAMAWYWPQCLDVPLELYLPAVLVAAFLIVVLAQYRHCGIDGFLANCGASCFSILYLGLLGAFVMAIRVDVGLWQTIMLIAVVKVSDVGAYTFGKLFGRHKLSPRVSPGKTWEGLAGAMLVAMAVALVFALVSGIMSVPLALAFGGCFAVIGQVGDLIESMMKRDAQQKDSSNRVPGFGGILDVVDSLLVALPVGYVFFRVAAW